MALAETLKKRGEADKSRATEDFAAASKALVEIQKLCSKENFKFSDTNDTLGDIRAQQFELTSDVEFGKLAIEAWQQIYCDATGTSSAMTRTVTAVKAAIIQQRLAHLDPINLTAAADTLVECVGQFRS